MSQVLMMFVLYAVVVAVCGSVYAWISGQFDRKVRDRHPGRAYGVAAVTAATGFAMQLVPDLPTPVPMIVGAVLTTTLLMTVLRMSFAGAIGAQLLAGLIGFGVGALLMIVAALGGTFAPVVLLGVLSLAGLVFLVRAHQANALRKTWAAVD